LVANLIARTFIVVLTSLRVVAFAGCAGVGDKRASIYGRWPGVAADLPAEIARSRIQSRPSVLSYKP
jgi:hypothetical protein